jgi:hypothetical protein
MANVMEFELKVIKDGKVSVETWEGIDGMNAVSRYQDTFPNDIVIAWREVVHGFFTGYIPGHIIG